MSVVKVLGEKPPETARAGYYKRYINTICSTSKGEEK